MRSAVTQPRPIGQSAAEDLSRRRQHGRCIAPSFPAGFRHRPELLDVAEEQQLLHEIAGLDFKPFDFRGFLGKRRGVSFGLRYDFSGGGLQKAGEIPEFLLPGRHR